MGGWRKRGKGTNMFKELNIADIFVLRYHKTAEGKYQQTYTPEEFDQMQEWLDRALGEYTQSMEVENNMLRARNERLEKTLAQQEQGEPFGWYDMEHGEIRDVEWNRQKPTYEGVWRPLYTSPQPAQKPWAGLMRGVRVEGDTVVISVKGGNDVARELCGALIEEKNT